ncbi:hypothetical protein EI94DRAFT_1701987 [Lactarius quietus]|nr:hypothetical protein EI94DRAFT_1701987 [Lactarius quietus]
MKKCQLVKTEDLLAGPSTVLGQAYMCALIMHSHEVDPQCTPDMIKEENEAQEYFEETKDILQLFCLSGWIDQFQNHVKTFIQECLSEAAAIMTLPGKAEENIVCLHGLQCLVASAIQEEELVQQHEYASACTKLDQANIWDGQVVNLRKFQWHYGCSYNAYNIFKTAVVEKCLLNWKDLTRKIQKEEHQQWRID